MNERLLLRGDIVLVDLEPARADFTYPLLTFLRSSGNEKTPSRGAFFW